MTVEAAAPHDVDGLVALAAGVEHWFGPMAADPGFHRALRRNITRGSAFTVRGTGGRLLGGILTGGSPPERPTGGVLAGDGVPECRIGWLVVEASARRRGVGRALVEHVIAGWPRPCRVSVVTFGADHPAAGPSGARAFYESLGFAAAEGAPDGPDGGTRQCFRRTLR